MYLHKELFPYSIPFSLISNGRDCDIQMSDGSWVKFEGEWSTFSSGNSQLTASWERKVTNVQIIIHTYCNGGLYRRSERYLKIINENLVYAMMTTLRLC